MRAFLICLSSVAIAMILLHQLQTVYAEGRIPIIIADSILLALNGFIIGFFCSESLQTKQKEHIEDVFAEFVIYCATRLGEDQSALLDKFSSHMSDNHDTRHSN